MSNLLSIHNSKNQVGIGTNNISVSSSLTIKEDSKRYIVFNTGNDSIDTHRTIELEDETTLSTVRTNSISSPKLLYIASNNLISSLSFSSSANAYLRISNSGGLSLVDKIAPVFSNVSPGTNSYINNANIGYTINETLTSGTVKFTQTSGTTDNNSPHTQVLAGSELNSGTRSSGALTNAPTLVSGAVYRIEFDGIDLAGNSASTVSITGIIFDDTNPIISNPGPASNSSVKSVVVSYELSEDLASGTITFTRTGGNASSNYTVNLAGSELNEGTHSNITLTNAPTLVSGAIYSIAFNGTDLAGNDASQVSVTGITYDTTAPVLTQVTPITTPSTDITPSFVFTSDEAGTLSTNITEGFSTSSSVTTGSNQTVTFNTLSAGTYSGKTITVTDAAGNATNLSIPSFTITSNPYNSSDIRYYMWEQNPTLLSGETRGEVGYILLKALSGFVVNNHVNGSSSYTVNENYVLYQEAGRYSGTNDEGVGGYNNYNNAYDYVGGETSKPFDIPNSISSRDSYGVRWGDNTIYPDEHIYKIVYAGSNHGVSNTFKIRNTRSLNWIPYYNTNGSSKSNPTTEETYFELKNNNSTNNTFQLYMPDRSKYFGCDYYLNGSTQSSLGYGYYREKSSNTTANINFDWRFHFI